MPINSYRLNNYIDSAVEDIEKAKQEINSIIEKHKEYIEEYALVIRRNHAVNFIWQRFGDSPNAGFQDRNILQPIIRSLGGFKEPDIRSEISRLNERIAWYQEKIEHYDKLKETLLTLKQ